MIDPGETPEQAAQLEKMDRLVESKISDYFARPEVAEFLVAFVSKDPRPYALFLTQVYRYTYHTARNQALVGVNPANTHVKYMRFCFEHAMEETGHELMAVHDLKAMGVPITDPVTDMPPSLPATELLVAYLYWVSTQGNPYQRLGFSYWAERSYGLFGHVVETMAEQLALDKKQMTFYFNHADIDDKHAQDVENILLLTCKTDEDWEAVQKVAAVTVDVSLDMLTQTMEAFMELEAGRNPAFDILNAIKPA